MAIRSLVETVGCQHLINRRRYLQNPEPLRDAYRFSEKLFAKLHSFRSSLVPGARSIQEEAPGHEVGSETPF